MILTSAWSPKPSLMRRMVRFFSRIMVSVLLASFVLLTMQYQKSVVLHHDHLDHPLNVALKEIDASVQQTEILAWTGTQVSTEPAFSVLKGMAESIATGFSPDLMREFWTESDEGYRVVYYSGMEQDGGRWLASARRIDGAMAALGVTEIALHRVLYGPVQDITGVLEWTKSRLRRSIHAATGPMFHRVKISARPASDGEPEFTARAVMNAVGADVRLLIDSNGELTLAGYTSRLPHATEFRGQKVNIVVRVSRHGQGDWIEIGHPVL